MNTQPEFKPFPKIARFSRDAIITEKIDGTNASICITEDGQFLTGSRNGWITPQKDNYGFSRWAHEHREELFALGTGTHFGEWWGHGCQRGYDLKEKRFSMFNVSRWVLHGQEPKQIPTQDPRLFKIQGVLPPCVGLVPVLWSGAFDDAFRMAESTIKFLIDQGSVAAPGFMKPEGIVIYHIQGNALFKKTIDKDEEPKSQTHE